MKFVKFDGEFVRFDENECFFLFFFKVISVGVLVLLKSMKVKT